MRYGICFKINLLGTIKVDVIINETRWAIHWAVHYITLFTFTWTFLLKKKKISVRKWGRKGETRQSCILNKCLGPGPKPSEIGWFQLFRKKSEKQVNLYKGQDLSEDNYLSNTSWSIKWYRTIKKKKKNTRISFLKKPQIWKGIPQTSTSKATGTTLDDT